MSRPAAAVALLLALAVALPASTVAAEAAAPRQPYIVMLVGGDDADDGAAAGQATKRNAAAVERVAARNAIAVGRRFEHLLAGFSADLTPGQVRTLAADPGPCDVALFQLSGGSTGVPKIRSMLIDRKPARRATPTAAAA